MRRKRLQAQGQGRSFARPCHGSVSSCAQEDQKQDIGRANICCGLLWVRHTRLVSFSQQTPRGWPLPSVKTLGYDGHGITGKDIMWPHDSSGHTPSTSPSSHEWLGSCHMCRHCAQLTKSPSAWSLHSSTYGKGAKTADDAVMLVLH